jgi:membrane protein YdbS with pleckstrin-like domain
MTRIDLTRVFAVPVCLALASAAGLVVGLVADGLWDVLACVAVAAPLAVVVLSAVRARR